MMNLLVYADLSPAQQLYLTQQLPPTYTTCFHALGTDAQSRDFLAKAQLLFGNPPVEWLSTSPSNLQYWQLESAGFDQYQGLSLKATVANMGNFFAQACAETMVAGLLALYRGINTLVRLQEQQNWQGKIVRSELRLLGNKKAIVLGAGTIGKAVKKILEGFGTQVKLTARTNPDADIHSKEALLSHLPHTDVVVNTLPGNLTNYVSKEFIWQMKKGSVYANVGRGNTTDESALICALQQNHLAGAVLDVTETEPLPANSPLWKMQNVLLTQHTGGGQDQELEGKIERFLMNLNTFLAGQAVADKIDLSQGY
ncbi:D-2-hydroxyacid dehydrogenase [Rufibacter immobilis]|nr:D-2-hydroxyacid dehydrogenase [Rufibacter immobilis]